MQNLMKNKASKNSGITLMALVITIIITIIIIIIIIIIELYGYL